MSKPSKGSERQEGGIALLGLRPSSPSTLIVRVRSGLPYASLTRFQERTTLPLAEIADWVQVPPRTLHRRKAAGRLAPDESDRLLRAARLFEATLDLFDGDVQAAKRWWLAPNAALEGLRPIDAGRTDIGARQVEQILGRIAHGIPA